MAEPQNISVALATYNGAAYVEEQIRSILDQDYPVREIVVSDDCSTDNTIKVIEAIESDKIIILKSDKNLGYIKNFEKACLHCSGDFIALADQDDIWEARKISSLIDVVGEEDSLAVFSDAVLVDKNGMPIGLRLSDRGIPNDLKKDIDHRAFYLSNCVTGCTMLFARKLLSHAVPFPEKTPHDWWLAYVAAYNGRLSYCADQLVAYRQHDSNTLGVSLGRNKNRFSMRYLESKLRGMLISTHIRKKKIWHDELVARLAAMHAFEFVQSGVAGEEIDLLRRWSVEKKNNLFVGERYKEFFTKGRSSPCFDLISDKGYYKSRYVSQGLKFVNAMIAAKLSILYLLIVGLLISVCVG